MSFLGRKSPIRASVAVCGLVLFTAGCGRASAVIGSGSATGSAISEMTGTTSGSSQVAASLPPGVVTAVNKTNVVLTTTLTAQDQAAVSTTEGDALLTVAKLSPGQAIAAQLVIMTSADFPSGEPVWAIDVVAAGGYTPRLYGAVGDSGNSNFEVSFVDARNGNWLFSVEAYDPQLSSVVP